MYIHPIAPRLCARSISLRMCSSFFVLASLASPVPTVLPPPIKDAHLPTSIIPTLIVQIIIALPLEQQKKNKVKSNGQRLARFPSSRVVKWVSNEETVTFLEILLFQNQRNLPNPPAFPAP